MSCIIISAIRLEAPITLVGRTALSVEIKMKELTSDSINSVLCDFVAVARSPCRLCRITYSWRGSAAERAAFAAYWPRETDADKELWKKVRPVRTLERPATQLHKVFKESEEGEEAAKVFKVSEEGKDCL